MGDPTLDRDRIIVEYYPLVQRVARKLVRRFPSSVELDDLISIGTMGLIEAVDRYDPARSGAFSTYARIRVQGAIVDALRKGDWVPRTVRRRSRDLDDTAATLHRELGRDPSEREIAARLGMTVQELDDARRDAIVRTVVSVEERHAGTELPIRQTLSHDDETPDELVERELTRERVAAALLHLPARDQAIVRLYYFEDMTLKEIGAVLGVTESRVSQLHSRARKRLRAVLEEEDAGVAQSA